MVRPHPLQPAERQALGCDRADHAPAARGRPRRPCVGPGGVGGRATAGNCRGGRAAPGRDGVRAAGLWPQRGEALYPEREPPEMLEQLRRTIGEYNFAGQYQQAPTPLGGGMVKAAWFKSYAANERPEKFDHIVQSWDTANKASELSDFSVCTSWGIKGKDLYLLHVLRKRMEYPELSRTDGPDASTSARAARRGKCSDRVSMTAHGAYPPLLQRSTNAGNCFKCGRRKSRGQDWRSASSTRCPRQHARAWLRRCAK